MRMYHASARNWKQLKRAPFLHLAADQHLALSHVSLNVPVYESVDVWVHTVAYDDQITDENSSLHWTGLWTSSARQQSERQIRRGKALLVSYFYDPNDASTLCVIVKKNQIRHVASRHLRITKTRPLPLGQSLSGNDAFTISVDIDMSDYYSITELQTDSSKE